MTLSARSAITICTRVPTPGPSAVQSSIDRTFLP
jgi:hypothetical protein